MPHDVRLGNAVQQQDRRTLPAPAPVDRRTRRGDVERLEALKHSTVLLAIGTPRGGHRPPVTSSIAPVTYEAWGDSSHRTAAEISSTVPMRRMGTWATSCRT